MDVRKDYKPYWCDEIQQTHDSLTRTKEVAEANPNQENNIKLQHSKARQLKTNHQCQKLGWTEKTSSLNNMETRYQNTMESDKSPLRK